MRAGIETVVGRNVLGPVLGHVLGPHPEAASASTQRVATMGPSSVRVCFT